MLLDAINTELPCAVMMERLHVVNALSAPYCAAKRIFAWHDMQPQPGKDTHWSPAIAIECSGYVIWHRLFVVRYCRACLAGMTQTCPTPVVESCILIRWLAATML